MNLINIENLTKVYTERKLFDGASFSLQDGEKVGIIGVNGTGKTTLLRMIMGEEETDEGTVTTANHVVMRYLPQHPEFEPEKSSLECVLEGNVTDENRWSVESDAKAMMTRLGIKDFMQPAGQLSGGQRKRLALISVLLSPADILLLDEPTNHLDNDMADWLEDYLKKDGKSNTSSVVNAHTPGAKKARLSYEVLGEAVDAISGKKKWLLRIHLDTGRHHQIRVQMAHAGMPLAGDRKYGAGTNVTIGAGSLALCAASLTFFHPVTGKVMKFVTKPEGTEFKGISIPQM